MKYPLVDLLQLLCLSTYSAWSAHTANLRISPPLPANQISQISLSCDANNFNVSFRMQSPFKGLVFAKDFAQECKTVGRYFSLLLYFFEQRKSTKSGNFAAQIPQKFKKILKFFSDILLRWNSTFFFRKYGKHRTNQSSNFRLWCKIRLRSWWRKNCNGLFR